jgi:mono/diheme cytochrome c family protein
LVRFILNPDAAAKTDPDAAALVKQFDAGMPITEGATPELVEGLLQHIERASGGAATPTTGASAERMEAAADVAAGRDLFAGRRRLASRAPACVSCHRIGSVGGLGGGTLGPDLTGASERLGGAHGVSTWLRHPPTKIMRALYRPRPLSEDERSAIAALLVNESTEWPARRSSRDWTFPALGIGGALAALGLMALVWSRRMTAVRRPMVDAARRRTGDRP